jgi:hypothetical protein
MKLAGVQTVYPDTSYWVAMRCVADSRHGAWVSFHPNIEHARLIWSPWTHFELLNTLRQLTRTTPPALERAGARQIIAALERELARGYYDLAILDWRDELRTCRELSAAHGYDLAMRSGDVVHVAVAKLCGADLFATCDADQHALAEAAGLSAVLVGG